MHPHDQRKKDDTLLAVQIYLHDPFGNLLVLTLSTGGHIEVILGNAISRSLIFIVILLTLFQSMTDSIKFLLLKELLILISRPMLLKMNYFKWYAI